MPPYLRVGAVNLAAPERRRKLTKLGVTYHALSSLSLVADEADRGFCLVFNSGEGGPRAMV